MRLVRRIWLVLVLLGFSAQAGAALAAPPTPAADDLRFTYYGDLQSANDSALTFIADGGAKLTFNLGADARLNVPGNPTAAVADLATGVRVRVTIERASPEAAWEVVRVRVMERGARQPVAQVQAQPNVAAHVNTYSEGVNVNVTRADGSQGTYLIDASTRLLPAGQVQAPAPGDPVLLLFKPGAPAGAPVWGIVVLPKPGLKSGTGE